MLSLAGYADRLSVRPGETIRFHVANATGEQVVSSIVRVLSADPNPAGMGIKTEALVQTGLLRRADAAAFEVSRGSYATVQTARVIDRLRSFTAIATILETKRTQKLAIVLSNSALDFDGVSSDGTDISTIGFSIFVTDNALAACVGSSALFLEQELESPCGWQHVWVSYDDHAQVMTVGQMPIGKAAQAILKSARIGEPTLATGYDLLIGCTWDFPPNPACNHFNGRIERPMIFDRALTPEEIARAFAGEAVPGLVAAWDFSREMHTNRIIDTGPHGLHGTLVNSPTRAVRGSNWTGREQCYRHAPEQYGAIHFHDDDIDDMQWPVTHEYTVPADLKSGAYALLLKAGDAEENIPFFVVPPKGRATAKLAVLVSTFTYTVYGNHARPEWSADPKWREAWIKQAKDWNAYPHNPAQHPEYGLSTYNTHTDGSGIAIASWHRPMLNLRIGYVTYPYPDIRGSGLRHYPADSHLLAWLEAKGYDYDLITDWELHHEGADLLNRYTCVLTGTHPEYHTTEMLDALEAYAQGGGRFMYLGGNGFYWKIALSPDKPGVIEIRRAEGGIRAWAAEPGEYYNQFDGEYGGLWRRNGRPPQKLVGVGFTAQGNFVGSHYRIRPEARADPRTAWMFDGISGETIGGFGFSGHGAAGFELDRADKRLGTPANAIVVAQSENHPPEAPWVLVPEEQLTHITTIPGESHKQLIRADMTFFATPNNGAVFSTGSITFCGSLPHNGFDNSISTLLGNVLVKFLDQRATFASNSI